MKRCGAEGTRLRVCPRWHLEGGEGVRSWGLRPSTCPPVEALRLGERGQPQPWGRRLLGSSQGSQRPLEAAGQAMFGGGCGFPISGVCPSVKSLPPVSLWISHSWPSSLLCASGPWAPCVVGTCPCSYCPSCWHLPLSEEGSCPEKQPFPLCPAMTRSHLSSGNRAGLLDPGAQWPPRHPGTWTCGTGHWVNQEQSDHSPALPSGGSSGQARAGGRERVLSCPQPLTLQIPPLGEWGAWPWGPSFVCPGLCPPRPSLPPPWLWHR